MPEEVAPPFENWAEHLKAVGDRELADLAKDYRWIEDEARPTEEREEFHSRREAIISECERRGMTKVADECRQPSRAE